MDTRSIALQPDSPLQPRQAVVASPPLAAEILPRSKAPAKARIKRVLLAGAAVALLAGASVYGRDWWTVGRFVVSTDDAYVKADTTSIAPKVSGYLSAVLVGDNQRVKAGEALARIDDRDFAVALDQAKPTWRRRTPRSPASAPSSTSSRR
jgi:membrane fusion protein (multidrug efflux system)